MTHAPAQHVSRPAPGPHRVARALGAVATDGAADWRPLTAALAASVIASVIAGVVGATAVTAVGSSPGHRADTGSGAVVDPADASVEHAVSVTLGSDRDRS